MALLYDAHGRELYEGGVTHDAIRDAIQAAARADDFKLAYEIAERYGWNDVCLYCAATAPTHEFWAQSNTWPICKPCKEELLPGSTIGASTGMTFADTKVYAHGLIKRNVI